MNEAVQTVSGMARQDACGQTKYSNPLALSVLLNDGDRMTVACDAVVVKLKGQAEATHRSSK